MDTKILAVAVVAIVAVAAVGAYVVLSDNDKAVPMNIIGRVNTDGSGIIVNSGDTSEYVKIDTSEDEPSEPHLGVAGKWIILNKDAWAGKIFTDPGAATIQHVQLSTIAKTMGLKFVQYTKDTSISGDTLYYLPGVPSYDKYNSELANNSKIAGGIFWEPQSSIATISGKCTLMTVTNDLFPGHTCCTIAGQSSYMKNHEDETVRFLAAYIKAVNQMKEAINAGSGEAYDEVIELAIKKVTMPQDFTKEQKKEAVIAAFEYVVYTYADSEYTDDPLADLKKDVANMAGEFKEGGLVRNGYSDLGFKSNQELADKFVDSSYMIKALHYEKAEKYDKTSKIKVSVIGGDIHQLAIHYAMDKGIFAEYGLEITLSSQSNGPGVYTTLKNNDSQLGFIGAPPMVINSMNDKSITA